MHQYIITFKEGAMSMMQTICEFDMGGMMLEWQNHADRNNVTKVMDAMNTTMHNMGVHVEPSQVAYMRNFTAEQLTNFIDQYTTFA